MTVSSCIVFVLLDGKALSGFDNSAEFPVLVSATLSHVLGFFRLPKYYHTTGVFSPGLSAISPFYKKMLWLLLFLHRYGILLWGRLFSPVTHEYYRIVACGVRTPQTCVFVVHRRMEAGQVILVSARNTAARIFRGILHCGCLADWILLCTFKHRFAGLPLLGGLLWMLSRSPCSFGCVVFHLPACHIALSFSFNKSPVCVLILCLCLCSITGPDKQP